MASGEVDWPPRLAAPDTLLGRLQRGLGSGAREALASGPSAATTVLAAFAIDPRWDRQIDERAEYFAGLVKALGIDVTHVDRLLRSHRDRTPEDELRREPVALQVLERLVQLGDADAVTALRREAVHGEYWLSAITGLVNGTGLDPLPGWEARVEGLAETVDARGAGWLADSGWIIGADETPWQDWLSRYPGMRAEFATQEERGLPKTKAAKGKTDLSSLSTAELLAARGSGCERPAAKALAERTSETDQRALLEAARNADLPMRHAAIKALAEQGQKALVPILLTLSNNTEPSRVAGAMFDALARLPIEDTREIAHQWFVENDDPYRYRAAANVFAQHGAGEDRDLVLAALSRALDQEPEADQYLICDLAEALGYDPGGGPYGALVRAFNEMRYSFGRSYVAEAIAATDPTFATTLAVDCLWDATTHIRVIGAEHASLTVPEAAARMTELASDPHEPDVVRVAAAARLA